MGHGGRMRGSGDNVKHGRYRLDVVRKFFAHEDSRAVEQVARGGCAVSVPGGLQLVRGHSPEQPGLSLL